MHRIDGAGHVNNRFVAEDPATLRPPTEITPEIMNSLQEELATFIEWAGLILAKGDNTQLKQGLLAKFALLESPLFTGNPRAPTASLNDRDTTLANTEFVYLLVEAAIFGLNISSYAKLASTQIFTRGQAGAEVLLSATTGPVTLDLAAGNNHGGTLTGAIVLANPENITPGQSGVIRLQQGAAATYTIAYGSVWKPADGASLPALTALVGSVDDLVYYVETATRIVVGRVGGSA